MRSERGQQISLTHAKLPRFTHLPLQQLCSNETQVSFLEKGLAQVTSIIFLNYLFIYYLLGILDMHLIYLD